MSTTTGAGLEGVIAGESEICYIDGYAGVLSYRGYNIHSLGELLRLENRAAEALPYLERAVTIEKRHLAHDHPDLAVAIHSLALALANLGQDVRAEELFRQSLDIREKALGPDNPAIADSLEGLAPLLRRTGRVHEAQSLEARAREIRTRQGARQRAKPGH